MEGDPLPQPDDGFDPSEHIEAIEQAMAPLGLHMSGAWATANPQKYEERMHEARILGQDPEKVDVPMAITVAFTTRCTCRAWRRGGLLLSLLPLTTNGLVSHQTRLTLAF